MRDAAVESVAVGFFDGVHLGHQAILRGATAAVTFRDHPLAVIDPSRAPRLIMTLEDRLDAIRACGVRAVNVLDFTPALARETPLDFMRRLGPRVRCGANWRFGCRGEGDAAFLRDHGVAVEVVPYAVLGDAPISSTRIRAVLETGDVVLARAMLGRPFSVVGTVFAGKGEGRRMGYPTVNLALDMALRLPFGVYAVDVAGVRAIANYGVAPTMGDKAWHEPCLEVHFADGVANAPSAGARLRVAFCEFFRPERRFETKEALVCQIADDMRRLKGAAC